VKTQIHVVQLRQLLDGKAAALQASLESLARGRYRRTSDCLKLLRAYQQLQDCSEKTSPRHSPPAAALTELRFILEQIQQPKTAMKLLQKRETAENHAAVAWLCERLEQRTQRHHESLAQRAAKAQKELNPGTHSHSLEPLTDATLRRLHERHLKRAARELVRHLERVPKEGVTAEQLGALRELLRRTRFLLEISSHLFENALPFDARLLDECREKLKKADQWQTTARLLHELEPEFNARPRPMAREWLKLMEEIQTGARDRARKLAKSMRRDNSHWAGLRFALAKLTQKTAVH
jgi:hypothetical protein